VFLSLFAKLFNAESFVTTQIAEDYRNRSGRGRISIGYLFSISYSYLYHIAISSSFPSLPPSQKRLRIGNWTVAAKCLFMA